MGMYFEIVAKSQYVYSFTTLHIIACVWIVGHCRVMLRANMVKLLVATVRNENDRLRLMEYKLHLMILSIKSERTSTSNYSKECSTMRHSWRIWNCSLTTWQSKHWNAQWLHSVNCFLYFFFCIRRHWTWLQTELMLSAWDVTAVRCWLMIGGIAVIGTVILLKLNKLFSQSD